MNQKIEVYPADVRRVLPRMRPASGVVSVCLGMLSSIFIANICVASDVDRSDIQARYLKERAACSNGESQQSKATCLQEAVAARQAALSGKLSQGDADQFQRNSERRCEVLSAADREDCVKRMHGEGTQSGSADKGGVFRELTVPVAPETQK